MFASGPMYNRPDNRAAHEALVQKLSIEKQIMWKAGARLRICPRAPLASLFPKLLKRTLHSHAICALLSRIT